MIKAFQEQKGFFRRIADNIKNWFDRTFDFHKETHKRSTPYAEIDRAQKLLDTTKKNLEQLKQMHADQIAEVKKSIEELNANAETTINNITNQLDNLSSQELQSNVRKIEDMIKQLEQARTVKSGFTDVLSDLHNMKHNIEGLRERELKEGNSLFEKQYERYKTDFKQPVTINGRTIEPGPDKAYEVLGLDPADNLTQEQINKKIQELTEQFPEQSDEWQAIRNAQNILSKPISRATYDAFLQDLQQFKNLYPETFDPTNLSDAQREFITKKGELAKLQISQEDYEKIKPFLDEDFTMQKLDIENAKKQVESEKGVTNTVKTIDATLNQARNLSSQLKEKLKASQPHVLP